MFKTILLFSDGTGNSASSPFKTNVFRVYDSLDMSPEKGQITYYDDGVGSSSHKILAAIGGAFGVGLKRNVLDLYKFLTRHYGDARSAGVTPTIACFGFSRGAFTIRVHVGLVQSQGLPIHAKSEAELDRLARRAYNAYRKENFRTALRIETPLRVIRDKIYDILDRRRYGATYQETKRENNIKIDFLGLWDTVGAYGMPVDELRIAIDRLIFPMTFSNFDIAPNVACVRHALSIDDERKSFRPVLFDDAVDRSNSRRAREACVSKFLSENGGQESAEARARAEDEAWRTVTERSVQLWFPGVHANVGGGYPNDTMSLLPLKWIMLEAGQHGVCFRQPVIDEINAKATAFGQIYDSRAGVGVLYRYKPRDINEFMRESRKRVTEALKAGKDDALRPDEVDYLPLVHESAIFRMAVDFDGYAPIALPEECGVVSERGRIQKLADYINSAKDRAGRFARSEYADIEGRMAAMAAAVGRLKTPSRDQLEWIDSAVWWRGVYYVCTVVSLSVLLTLPFAKLFSGLDLTAGIRARLAETIGAYISPTITSAIDRYVGDAVSLLSGVVDWIMDTAAKFAPPFSEYWLDAFRAHPVVFAGCMLIGLLSWRKGATLKGEIADRSRIAWGMMESPQLPGTPLLERISNLLRKFPAVRAIKTTVYPALPYAVVLVGVLLAVVMVDHMVFLGESYFGAVCEGSVDAKRLSTPTQFDFPIDAPCHRSALLLEKGRSYVARFELLQPWTDDSHPATSAGLDFSNLDGSEKMKYLAGIFFRREWLQPWLKAMIRVGEKGDAEFAVDADASSTDGAAKQELSIKFKAPNDGELFVFVNDAYTGFLPIAWLTGKYSSNSDSSWRHSYGDNKGAARVTVTALGPGESGD